MAEDSEARHGGNKNGKKEGISGSSFFTWFMVIALLGVWTSVAVVWFELVDYEEVLAKAKDFRYNLSEVLQGKLGIYDADGDGDFDVEDAKALLGLKERSVPEQQKPRDAEEVTQPTEEPHGRAEHKSAEAEPEEEDEMDTLLRQVLESEFEKINEADEETAFQEENSEIPEVPTEQDVYDKDLEDKVPEVLETPESFYEGT
uniref:Aspartyl beta-hydroxylase/Triadin domain-containing protein n=1 Tax=Podarcis muralis TaxID=64176 RepID=A0A670IGW1_PODMU